MIAQASAAILAGGLSTRMGGIPKALLELEGKTILERQLAVLRPSFTEVVLVAPDAGAFARFGLRVVADLVPGKGAPGGVHAALASSSEPWVFCLACDMPFVRADVVELLAARRHPGARAVVPERKGGHLEPLFAFYSTKLRDDFERAFDAGPPSPSLARLLADAERVTESEIARIDPGCLCLANVNTPDDLERARRLIQAGR